MVGNSTQGIGRQLRLAALQPDAAGMTDGQLLACFLDSRDDAAFAALVRRHGPMVWGVCRRLLSSEDAEDAFQATFLVLVHKAASIVPREMVGAWLHGVARRTALQARRTATRRRRRERQVTAMPEPADTSRDAWHELQPLLDQELSRLPDRYRAVLILCDLEGKTRQEAARQLGVPDGSVAGWLARARARLARQLTRQGVALSGAAVAGLLSENVASGWVPASVLSATLRGASAYGATKAAAAGVVPIRVVALTEGVLKSMSWSKLRVVATTLLAAVVLAGIGADGLLRPTRAAQGPRASAIAEGGADRRGAKQADRRPTDGYVKIEVFGPLGSLVRQADGKAMTVTVRAAAGEFPVDVSRSKPAADALARLADLYAKPGATVIVLPKVRVTGRLEFRTTKAVGAGPKAWVLVADSVEPAEDLPRASARREGFNLRFSEDSLAEGVKATLDFLNSCSDASEGTADDLKNALKGDHVRFVFPRPVQVSAVRGGTVEISELVLTLPLNTGVFWLRSGTKVLRHTKYRQEKEAAFLAWLGQAEAAE